MVPAESVQEVESQELQLTLSTLSPVGRGVTVLRLVPKGSNHRILGTP
jgi:hypothetical protein